MHINQLVFAKHRVEHTPEDGLAWMPALPKLEDFDPADGWPAEGSIAPLVDPFAGIGMDDNLMPAPRDLDSRDIAAQYLELLWMAILRDVPFHSHGSHVLVREARAEMSQWGVDDFARPNQIHDGGGPYISRLLEGSVPDGDPVMRRTRYCSDFTGQAYGTNMQEICDIQNGQPPDMLPPTTTNEMPMGNSGRTLGSVVRADYPLKFCIQASLLLAEMGVPVQGPGDDGPRAAVSGPFVWWNVPHLHRAMGEMLHVMLRSAWAHKKRFKMPRPEVYGMAVEHRRRGHAEWQPECGIPEELLHTQAVRLTVDKYGTALLPLCYPEGSPAHDSYPAGHSFVAAGCGALMKCWFEDHDWPGDMRKDAPTIHQEINKMTLNVATGRSWAGVHWRDDNIQGCLAAEELAFKLYPKLVNADSPVGIQKQAKVLTLAGDRESLYFGE